MGEDVAITRAEVGNHHVTGCQLILTGPTLTTMGLDAGDFVTIVTCQNHIVIVGTETGVDDGG